MSAYIQGSPEWLEMRKRCVGASDAPIIMGVSPWKTAYQLWEEKVGVREPDEMNAAMRRGVNTEEEARNAFIEMIGVDVMPQVIHHPKYKWMIASMDGLSLDQSVAVEIKCPGAKTHEIAKNGSVPEHYLPQLQHQMEVCGLDSIYYFSYFEGDGVILKIERDTPYIRKMLKKEEEFHTCMKNFIAPPYSEKDLKLKSDDFWNQVANEWMEAHGNYRMWERKEKELRDTLIMLASGQSCRGGGIRVQRNVRRGTIDYGAIDELKNMDLEKYRKKPMDVWQIRIEK